VNIYFIFQIVCFKHMGGILREDPEFATGDGDEEAQASTYQHCVLILAITNAVRYSIL